MPRRRWIARGASKPSNNVPATSVRPCGDFRTGTSSDPIDARKRTKNTNSRPSAQRSACSSRSSEDRGNLAAAGEQQHRGNAGRCGGSQEQRRDPDRLAPDRLVGSRSAARRCRKPRRNRSHSRPLSRASPNQLRRKIRSNFPPGHKLPRSDSVVQRPNSEIAQEPIDIGDQYFSSGLLPWFANRLRP